MLNKKGKILALSCVALSTTVLAGISTNVRADTHGDSKSGTSHVHTQTADDTMTALKSNDEIAPIGDLGIESDEVDETDETAEEDNFVKKIRITAADDFANSDNKRFGVATHFHIFANEAKLTVHVNGNVAVGHVIDTHAFGTNIKDGSIGEEVYYIQNFDSISKSAFIAQNEIRKNKVIFGENNEILFDDSTGYTVNGVKFDSLTKGEVHQDDVGHEYINFASEFAYLRGRSLEIANKKACATLKNSDLGDMNSRVIDVSEYDMDRNEYGQIVINLDAEVLDMSTPLTISGLSPDVGGDDIIINVDTGNATSYNMNSQIKLAYTDGTERSNHETENFDNNHLLWNFVNGKDVYEGSISMNSTFQGGVLAPGAEISIHHNLDGNIIADKVFVVGGETHRWDFGDTLDPLNPENPNVIPPVDPEKPDPEKPDPEKPDPEKPDPETPDPETPDPEKPDPEKPDPETPDPEVPDPEEPDPEDPERPITDGGSQYGDGGDSGDPGGSGGSIIPDVIGNTTSTTTPSKGSTLPNTLRTVQSAATSPKPTSTSYVTPKSTGTSTLPSAGAKSGIMATIAGFLVLAFGSALQFFKMKKD